MNCNFKRNVSGYVKVGIAIVSMVGTMILSNISVAKAEEIIHTHIWATKYDKEKHWEYCTVCNKIKNESKHSFKDNWILGEESCLHKNYSTRICDCGYSYIYNKPHGKTSGWKQTCSILKHYTMCEDCGTWITSGECKNSAGNLSCKNPGVCVDCNKVVTKDNHYITCNGVCKDCGVKLVDISKYTLKYSSDYTNATISFTIKPCVSGLELTGDMNVYSGDVNYSDLKWSYVKNSDMSVTYIGVFTFDKKTQRKSTVGIGNSEMFAKMNNTYIYIDTSIANIQIWQDHTKPENIEVKQVDQTKYKDWATIKELTITGKEDLSNFVTISIIDKKSNDVIVDKARTEVKNEQFSYKCTPPLEGPDSGRDYIVRVTDSSGNTAEKVFTVYRTDCRAPLLRKQKEFVEWSKTKNIEFKLTDYGSGAAQSSIGDQVSYKDAKKDGEFYKACYTFTEDNYGISEYNLYLRDGLGNAGKEIVKVGKIDNTKPTMTEVKGDVQDITVDGTTKKAAVVTITANDLNTKLNAEGSGVKGYAVTKTKEEPKDTDWQESNTLTITEAGEYYLWVKDAVGNIADIQVINVKEDFTIELKDKISYDNGTEEKYEEVKNNKTDDTIKEDSTKKKNVLDDTPKTADNMPLILIISLLLVSGIALVIIRMKKTNRV